MNVKLARLLIASILALLPTLSAWSQSLDPEVWRADLATLSEHLKATHLNLYHTVSESDFDQSVAELNNTIPTLSDGAITLEMQRIVASINDGHTWLASGPLPHIRKYPIEVYWFDDGIYVTRTTKSHTHLIGSKVLRIGNASPEEALHAADPYTTRDNEWTVKERIVRLLTTADFLHAQGFVPDMENAPFTFEDNKGEAVTVDLKPISLEAYRQMPKPVVDPDDLPRYRRDTSATYWMEFIKKHKTVYMQFNAVANKEGGPHLARFSADLIELFESKRARNLIIDVRHNGGGNGDMLTPLIRRLAEHKNINRPGHLFVLTSRQTFSAALMFIMRTERQTHAIFGGEPSGGKPNSYGEFNAFELSNSKLHGSVSTRFHQEGEPNDTREFLPVDISVPLTGKDYFANHDPVLQAVFDYIDAR